MSCTNTCDVCGKTENALMNSFTWGRPPGWMTVSGLGPVITADTPMQHQARQPDLCSWACVAVFASERASREGDVARQRTAVAMRRAAQEISPIERP